MKNIIFILFALGILITFSACSDNIAEKECIKDSDCATAGCSGEICTTKEEASEIVTTCIYKPEFDCLKKTSCKCINGKCQWEPNEDYIECLNH